MSTILQVHKVEGLMSADFHLFACICRFIKIYSHGRASLFDNFGLLAKEFAISCAYKRKGIVRSK